MAMNQYLLPHIVVGTGGEGGGELGACASQYFYLPL